MDIFNLVKYILAIGVSCFVANYSTELILQRCRKANLVDTPNGRKLHTTPIPRLGGMAVFLAFFCTSFLIIQIWGDLSLRGYLNPGWWYQFVTAASLLLIIGIFDDLYELSPLFKLAGQFVAASLLFSFGTSIGSIATFELHPVIDFGLTTFWFLLVINALNLIDGLDGLAGGLAAIAATGLFGVFMLSNEVFGGLIMLCFIGSICGFLRYNFHPAKIFLGDCGSMFLGFSLAAFTLVSPSKGSTIATLGACILALGVPLLDTILAVWRRSLRRFFGSGSGVMQADMEHLHHRLVQRGFDQRKVALTMYALTAGLVGVGLLSLLFSSYAHGIYLIAFTVGTYIVVRHLANVELWDSGTVIASGLRRPTSSVLTTSLYPIVDVFALSVSFLAACYFAANIDDWSILRALLVSALPIWVGVTFIALAVSSTYQRVWSRARVSEYVYLVLAFGVGVFLSAGLTKFFEARAFIPDLVLFTTLFFGIGGGLLTGIRALPRVVSDLMMLNSAIAAGEGVFSQRRVLILGANALYLRYLKEFDWGASSVVPFKVVGLVDADKNLRKRIVYGYHVLGTPDELPKLLSEVEVDEIVIAGKPTGVDIAEVIALGRAGGITVKAWNTSEEILMGIEAAVNGIAQAG